MSSSSNATTRLSRRRLAGLLLAAALTPLGSTMIAVALPGIAIDLQADAATLTMLLATSYLLVGIVLQSPGGKLGDLFGHARIIAIGEGVFLLGAVAGLLAADAVLLTASRMLMAAGGALVIPGVVALMRVHVPAERRSAVFGWIGAVMGLSAAIGPPLGGYLVEHFGWRSIFFIGIPVVAAATLLHGPIWQRPPVIDAMARRRPRLDWIGMGLQLVALPLLVIAARMPSALAAGLAIGGGLVLLVVFVLYELRATEPVIDPRLFRTRAFAAGTVIVGLQNLAMYGLLFQVAQLFKHLRDVPPAETGRMLFAMMIGMVVGSPLGGLLSERIGARLTAFGGALITIAGMCWLLDVSALLAPLDAVPGLLMLGLGLGLTNTPCQAAAMNAIRKEQSGMASGVMSTVRYLGGTAGITAIGILLVGDAMNRESAHHEMFVLFLVSLIASALLTLLLPGRGAGKATDDLEGQTQPSGS
ncbi:MAG: MFS transporter [Planctomycetota bacterium]